MLETERLLLRELEPGDLDDLAELFGDPEVTRYYQRPPAAHAWLDRNRALYVERGFGLWAVILKETGAWIGDCGLVPQVVEGVDEIEVGYHLKPAFWGRGFAAGWGGRAPAPPLSSGESLRTAEAGRDACRA